ncbi:tumor necrosis factor receptor superfamily member 14-like [Gadus macrocephalus]|uniref:tumor necrosis factor receptor superfamily member 14-like n=1 Tax=Gadus macrocephalus TaxID=80720 RepID=UPI0028CB82A2|nr:tumor necrosis factor receptor superfamily member 14-like [Gadus macrocephalus]
MNLATEAYKKNTWLNCKNMFFQLMFICSDYIPNIVAGNMPKCYMEQQYIVRDLCCPKCPPGKMISEDCKEQRITTCTICPNGTFQEGLNHQRQCVSTCTKCDAGLGLKVKKSCSSTSDAVCEVLDGFFCSDSNGGGCRAAQRHTVCSPGQYIGQRGTADKDTECLHCTDGTFSNGTSSSCQNHIKCESVGLKLMKPGTDSTDSECGEHGPHRGLERRHVAGIMPGVILVMALMGLIIAIIHRKDKKSAESTRQNIVLPPNPLHNGTRTTSVPDRNPTTPPGNCRV